MLMVQSNCGKMIMMMDVLSHSMDTLALFGVLLWMEILSSLLLKTIPSGNGTSKENVLLSWRDTLMLFAVLWCTGESCGVVLLIKLLEDGRWMANHFKSTIDTLAL